MTPRARPACNPATFRTSASSRVPARFGSAWRRGGLALLLLTQLSCAARPTPASRPHADAPAPAVQVISAPRRRGESRKATASELVLVQELMHETERLRGLPFLAPVEVSVEDRVAMSAYVERAIDDAQLQRATRRYLALGALAPETDIRALLISVMEEELIGYYDPTEKRLAVRADIARALGSAGAHDERSLTWRATVVHELVHALQDQHFQLGRTIGQQRSTDADNAFGALIEGDATLVMLGYTAAHAGSSLAALVARPEQILSMMERAPEQLTGALRSAPALLREPLLFRYREGAHFCAELYRAGGWPDIDRAHRAPPQTTSSIRHASRYLARALEPALPAPELEPAVLSGFRVTDVDVLGALELSVLLGGAPTDADALVAAWRGDHYAVLEKADELASIWWLRLSTSTAARNVASAFVRFGDDARRITRQGAFVLVTRGLDARAQAAAAAWFLRASAKAVASPRKNHGASAQLAGGDPLASAMHQH
ncbi:MAG: hypothetical protein JWN48_5190 [Myxococcaceae bacterium]|nr:hypothetical protein [Myxococcaceae bacterium]